MMSHTCPECGAALDEGSSCEEIFNACLALEFSDPGYGAMHLLTVACYMIQHGRYSDEALRWIEPQMRAFLDGTPTEQIRRQAAGEAAQGAREWKVTRLPGARQLPRIAWSTTIAGLAPEDSDANGYCNRVRQWARATLDEMQPWLALP